MAAYPTLPTAPSPQKLEDGREIDRASNGSARGRVFFSSTKRTISVKHPMLTDADVAIHDGHYSTHRNVSFSYTDPLSGVSRTVIYGPALPVQTPVTYNRRDVEFELVEV